MSQNIARTVLTSIMPLALSVGVLACNRGSSDDNGSTTPAPQATPEQGTGKDGEAAPALQLTDSGVTVTLKVDKTAQSALSDESSVLITRRVDVGDYDNAVIYVVVDTVLAARPCYVYYDKQYRARQNFMKFAVRTLFGMDEKTFAASAYDFTFDGSHLGMTTDSKLASVFQIPSLPGKFLTLWISPLESEPMSRNQTAEDVPAPPATSSPGSASSSSASPTPTPQPADTTPDCKGEVQFRIYGKRKI